MQAHLGGRDWRGEIPTYIIISYNSYMHLLDLFTFSFYKLKISEVNYISLYNFNWYVIISKNRCL